MQVLVAFYIIAYFFLAWSVYNDLCDYAPITKSSRVFLLFMFFLYNALGILLYIKYLF